MGPSNGWGYSAALAGINLFLWIVTIIKYRTAYLKNPAFSSRYIFVGFILILYSTFAFAEADTYHYEYIFNNMRAYQERGHIEVFYYWLSQIISNYYVWRIAIWGTAAWLIIQCCKRMNLNANIVGFLLPILFFRQFSLTRGTLGFALLMFCVVLLFNSSRYYLRIIAIIGIICTSFFHRSLPAFLLLIPIAYLFPLSKKNVIISIILFPFLYKIIGVLLVDFLSVDLFSDETSEAGMLYLEDERKAINWKGYLGYFVQSVGLILLLYSLIRYYIAQKDVVNHACRFFIKYAYVLIYLSFLLFEQDLSSYLSPRSLHAATFPLLFSTAYYLQNTQRTFNDKMAIGLLSLHSLYNILYFMYKY